MIIMIVAIIVLFILGVVLFNIGTESYSDRIEIICMVLGVLMVIASIVLLIFGCCHGFIYYNESNDKDLARITAVTQEQNWLHTYYKVEVEYLTNTPSLQGQIEYYNIEKDTFYCYYNDKELVEKLKNNMYKELWLISGYKEGYNGWKDFGTKLVKDIELKED